ncbi:SAM-dependent methyltransferase [Streptomyces sp. NPDC088768]|uniref:SAM-dependent methyltransferase n=1 Tax=Streptomyces sp. NPDC088768 TaxID=3365894 RepID=UPI00380317D2
METPLSLSPRGARPSSARLARVLHGEAPRHDVDVQVADAADRVAPWLRALVQAETELAVASALGIAQRGARQIVVLGPGLPVRENDDATLAGIVLRLSAAPVRVIVVDRDPIVISEWRQLESDTLRLVQADCSDPDLPALLKAPGAALDPATPTALLAHDLLPWVPDTRVLTRTVKQLTALLRAGGVFSWSHIAPPAVPHRGAEDLTAVLNGFGLPWRARDEQTLLPALTHALPTGAARTRWSPSTASPDLLSGIITLPPAVSPCTQP